MSGSRSGTVRNGAAGSKITFTGPFFEKDVAKTFRENARAMLAGMAREGEATVKGAMPHKSGLTAAGVRGRVASLAGKPWMLTVVVSQTRIFPWKNHKSARSLAEYRGGKLEAKQHQFRRTASALRSSRAAAIADLTKGLN